MLFPERLEDYVSEDDPVRAIDAHVDGLDVESLGFKTRHSDKNNNGRPAFCPKLMLKLTIYGYNHKIRSSRHLAREAHRNIDLIWLLQGLKPAYTTIAQLKNTISGKESYCGGDSAGALSIGAIIGRTDDLVDVAVLVSCPCNLLR